MQFVALNTFVALAFLWMLLFWCYAQYRIDKFRQDMFALRDELFDEARSGRISFDDPAYKHLRDSINGFIKMGHRLSMFQMIAFQVVAAKYSRRERKNSVWENLLARHDKEIRVFLDSFQSRMHLCVIDQVVLGSPLITLSIVVPAICLVATHAFSSRLLKFLRVPLERADSAAMVYPH